jgi:hypothetical protein
VCNFIKIKEETNKMYKKIRILNYLILLSINFFLNSKVYDYPVKALFIVPIADLVGEAFEQINPKSNIKEEYKKLSISPEKGKLSCPRIHQMLFNEQADIIEEYEQEYKIKISSVFHQGISDLNFNCTYCTLKDNLLPIDQVNEKKLLPENIDFNATTFDLPYENTITLILPFYDQNTKKIYSAGTRFIVLEKADQNYIVAIYNPETNSFIKSIVNKKFAIESILRSNKEKLQIFIALLNLWTNLDDKFAPYVLGGISMAQLTSSDDFKLEKDKNCLGDEILFYKRSEFTNIPYSGFDCSTLIARATQICEIPYFFKNTTTLAKLLKSLEINDEISNGDLIWFHGHVIIIADKDSGNLIEARGYSSGFGKLHKIHISKVFQNKYFDKIPLELLNKKNEVNLKINNFKILKLNSVWSWNKNNVQTQQ